MPAEKNKTAKATYPQPLSSRFEDTTVNRIHALVKVLSKKWKFQVKKSDILEICVANHLPVLEREHGLEQPAPPQEN